MNILGSSGASLVAVILTIFAEPVGWLIILTLILGIVLLRQGTKEKDGNGTNGKRLLGIGVITACILLLATYVIMFPLIFEYLATNSHQHVNAIPNEPLSQTYTNNTYGFQFNYPANYQLVEGDISKTPFDYQIPIAPEFVSSTMIVTVEMPTSTYPADAHFSGGFMSVSVTNTQNASDCLVSFNTAGYLGPEPIGGIMFSGLSMPSEPPGPAMNHLTDDAYYNTFANDLCYVIHVGYRESATSTIVNENDIYDRLGEVLYSFRFK